MSNNSACVIFLVFALLLEPSLGFMPWPHTQGYHNYKKTNQLVKELNEAYPNLTRIYTIGKTFKKNSLSVLMLTSPPHTGVTEKRDVRLIGGIHGNELVGPELLLNLAYLLLSNYSKPHGAGELLNRLRIHILPTMNPDVIGAPHEGTCDGFGKSNANGMNLDHNFPVLKKPHDIQKHEAETKAVMRWMLQMPTVLSVTLRGGDLVVAYPYETAEARTHRPQTAPDQEVLVDLAKSYAEHNLKMKQGMHCLGKSEGGVLHGAKWRHGMYEGGIQDYSYGTTGSMDLNIATSCCKYPHRTVLASLWKENEEAFVNLLARSVMGINGVVKDAKTQRKIPQARIVVSGKNVSFFSSEKGYFSRIVLEKKLTIEVSKEGYHTKVQTVDVNTPISFNVLKKTHSMFVGHAEVLLARDTGDLDKARIDIPSELEDNPQKSKGQSESNGHHESHGPKEIHTNNSGVVNSMTNLISVMLYLFIVLSSGNYLSIG